MSSETIDRDQIKSNVKNTHNWRRLLYMVLFAVFLQLAAIIMWVLCSIQFLFVLLTGQDNENLRQLGSSIASFVHHALRFLSYNTDDKPFPFEAWPAPEESEGVVSEQTVPADEPVDEPGDVIEGEVIEISPTDESEDNSQKDA